MIKISYYRVSVLPSIKDCPVVDENFVVDDCSRFALNANEQSDPRPQKQTVPYNCPGSPRNLGRKNDRTSELISIHATITPI